MAVKTRWERPEGRRYLSVSAPLFVEYGGGRMRAAEWSLGGLRVVDAAEPLPAPDTVLTLRLALPFQGFEITFPVVARVASSGTAAGAFTVEFTELGERERGILMHFIDELVRGSMAEVGDTIQRIDVPVAPLSLELAADAAPDPARPRAATPRTAGAGLMTCLYASLGLLLLSYLGLMVYSSLFRFEIDSATLSIPSETVVAQGEGHVLWAEPRPGDNVKAGDVVARIYDNQLEREIELAEIAVREREARMTLLQRRAGDEPQRLASIATGQSQSIARTRLEIDSLRARMQAAEQEAKRVAALPRIALGAIRLEEAKKKVIAYQKAVEGKQIELKARLDKEAAIPGRTGGQQTEASREMSLLEAQVVQAEQDLEFAQQRHQVLIGHRERLAARAPFDGVLLDLPRGDKAGVRKGEIVAHVEQRALPTVAAYLSPADVNRIGIGDSARLYVPSSGAFLEARIAQIDRMAAGNRDAERNPALRRALMRNPAEVWSRIELHPVQPELMSDRRQFAAALPVVVQFQRRWAYAMLAAVRERGSLTFAAVRHQLATGQKSPVSRAEARP